MRSCVRGPLRGNPSSGGCRGAPFGDVPLNLCFLWGVLKAMDTIFKIMLSSKVFEMLIFSTLLKILFSEMVSMGS